MNAHQRRIARRKLAAQAPIPVQVIKGSWRLGVKAGWLGAVIYKWNGLYRVIGK